MNVFVCMIGVQSAGKSTFIKEHGLEDYTVCPDQIRVLLNGTTYGPDGSYGVDYFPRMERKVWQLARQAVQSRLERGQLTILDATNVRMENLRPFLQIAKDCGSRIAAIDMMLETSFEQCLERNRRREFNPTPEYIMETFYSRYQLLKLPGYVQVLAPSQWESLLRKPTQIHERFEHIAVLGDIHGCYETLMEALAVLPDRTLKIFVGDLCDRGPDNAKMAQFLIDHAQDEDMIFLEGNHEPYLRAWAQGQKASSGRFNEESAPQLERAGVSRKNLRRALHRLRVMAYFEFGGRTFVVTHGGLSSMGRNLLFVDGYSMIHGCGEYEDMEQAARSWDVRAGGVIQIHGHRNETDLPIQESERSYNLEGKIEYGGDLRMVLIHGDGSIEPIEIPSRSLRAFGCDAITVDRFVEECRSSGFIREKSFGEISSFNFIRQAFYGRVWNHVTQKARGLYINTSSCEIVARGFDKFFNIGELPGTEPADLAGRMRFPVEVFRKENGFLGLVGYDRQSNELIVTSKSDLTGPFARLVRENLEQQAGPDGMLAIEDYVKEHRCTLALEVCDICRDPHIIEYAQSGVFLLGVIANDLTFSMQPYDQLCQTASALSLPCKTRLAVLHTPEQFLEWLEQDYGEIEGFVFQDADGFMVKYKTPFYQYWKHKRSLIQSDGKGARNRLDRAFLRWYRSRPDLKGKDIITLRKAYLAEKPDEFSE